MRLARDAGPALRCASLDSLRRLQERRALPLALEALGHRETELAALEYLGELGGPEAAEAGGTSHRKKPLLQTPPRGDPLLAGGRGPAGAAVAPGGGPRCAGAGVSGAR